MKKEEKFVALAGDWDRGEKGIGRELGGEGTYGWTKIFRETQ